MLKKFFAHRKSFVFAVAALFAFMLLLNLLTGFYADDFVYMNSFATSERISSIADIFTSMKTHSVTMNGRLASHFFVQLFLFLPSIFFEIINSALFVALLLMLVKMSKAQNGKTVLLLCAFSLLWVFTPAFGQVFLWLDGSCNYLWADVFCFGFLYVFARFFLEGKKIANPFVVVLFCIFSFLCGSYSENISLASFLAAFILLIAAVFYKKRKFPYAYAIFLLFFAAGLAFLFFREASAKNDISSLGLRVNFMSAVYLLKKFWILLLIFLLLTVGAFLTGVDKDKIILSVILGVCGVLSVLMLTFTAYIPERRATFCVVLLAAGILILLSPMLQGQRKVFFALALTALFFISSYHIINGANDIYSTYRLTKENEEYLISCRENGEMYISLPMFTPYTKYSPVYDLKYLDTEDPLSWPNSSMAAFYDVEEIIGYYP